MLSTGLRGDQGLEVVEIPPRSVRHFVTIEFPTSSKAATAGLPEGRWTLRVLDRGTLNANGILRLEARQRQCDDPRGAQRTRAGGPTASPSPRPSWSAAVSTSTPSRRRLLDSLSRWLISTLAITIPYLSAIRLRLTASGASLMIASLPEFKGALRL